MLTLPSSLHNKAKNNKIVTITLLVLLLVIIFISFKKYNIFLTIQKVINKEDISAIINNSNNEIKQIHIIQQYYLSEKLRQQVSKKNYKEALSLITNKQSSDYFNRGVIKTIRAYEEAQSNTLSGIQHAKILIANANKDFERAQKLLIQKNTTKIVKVIETNTQATKALGEIIGIKSCYKELEYTILQLQILLKESNIIKDVLLGQQQQLKHLKSLITVNIGKECFDNLEKVLNTSYQHINNLQQVMKNHHRSYIYTLRETLQHPKMCHTLHLEELTPIIETALENLNEYKWQNFNNIMAFSNKDLDLIQQMCEQTWNDGQWNEKTQQSLNNMLNGLEKALNPNPQKQESKSQEPKDSESGWEEETETKEDDKQKGQGTQIQYKDILNEEEKQILKKTNEKNYDRMKQMNYIKSQENYNAQEYIQELFNEFYGNSGDFQNLQKWNNSNWSTGLFNSQR